MYGKKKVVLKKGEKQEEMAERFPKKKKLVLKKKVKKAPKAKKGSK